MSARDGASADCISVLLFTSEYSASTVDRTTLALGLILEELDRVVRQSEQPRSAEACRPGGQPRSATTEELQWFILWLPLQMQ